LRRHFDVEKELAARLLASSRSERMALLGELYGELFERVPDHPRLVRARDGDADLLADIHVRSRLRLLTPYADKTATLVEIAPGDCRAAYAACEHFGNVIGADISDQRAKSLIDSEPDNFQMLTFDGFSVPVASDSADVVFSYQMVEHLHPDDIANHFQEVARILKPGGCYVLDTPNRLTGPHDISRHFGNDLVCFHFREWTHHELLKSMREWGFGEGRAFRLGRELGRLETNLVCCLERTMAILPAGLRRRYLERLLPAVTLACRAR